MAPPALTMCRPNSIGDRTSAAIPGALAVEMGLRQFGEQRTLGFGGSVVFAAAYYVYLVLHDFPPLFLRVIANDEEPYVLLGRDVLNRFRITLDGPEGIFTIESGTSA